MTDKRFVLVVNPRSGTRRGPAVMERVKPVFAAAGAQLDVRLTEAPGHAGEIAQTLDLHRYDGFCVIGGDGTVHEVADGLMQRGEPISIPLGLIPGGTGNTLYRHLHGASPVEAARRILDGRTCRLDAVRVAMENQVVFCIDIIGWGGVADINVAAERLRMLGSPRYALAALWWILRGTTRRARVVLDAQTFDDEFLFVIACNARSVGSRMRLAPRAELDDGKIDVVVVRQTSRLQMLRLFARVFDGSHVSLPCVEYYQVRRFAIESDGHEPLDLDGEIKGSVPMCAEVIPGALRVFV